MLQKYRNGNVKAIECNTERISGMVDAVRLAILLIDMKEFDIYTLQRRNTGQRQHEKETKGSYPSIKR